MEYGAQTGVSKGQLWTGRILSGLAAAFLLFDATIHILKPAPVIAGFTQLGFPVSVSVPLGVLELVFVILYLIPRTSVFGAILLTGYLGGAIAAQVRISAPLFSTILFPIYVALFGMICAVAIALGHDVNLVLAIPLYLIGTLMRVSIEERLLREMFGQAFDDYARRVKRFIPHVW